MLVTVMFMYPDTTKLMEGESYAEHHIVTLYATHAEVRLSVRLVHRSQLRPGQIFWLLLRTLPRPHSCEHTKDMSAVIVLQHTRLDREKEICMCYYTMSFTALNILLVSGVLRLPT